MHGASCVKRFAPPTSAGAATGVGASPGGGVAAAGTEWVVTDVVTLPAGAGEPTCVALVSRWSYSARCSASRRRSASVTGIPGVGAPGRPRRRRL